MCFQYNNELMEHLDVIILGGYYGEGRLRGGLVSQFLLGVAKPPAIAGKNFTMGMITLN